VSTDRLVDALWGEQPPPTAPTSLRNAVSQLRKILGSDALETRDRGYTLRVADDRFDLVRFERLLREARDVPAPARGALLREALGEWRGRPLAELAFEPFLAGEIRRLEELRVSAQEDALEADLEAGLHNEIVVEIQTLVSEHPHRERLRGQLMTALYRSGRQAEALQAYQEARRALAEELGIEPSPALRQLHGALLRQEAGLSSNARRGSEVESDHLNEVVDAILAGRVVPVIALSPDFAPSLAERFRYPPGGVVETPRVSQYAAALRGYGPLYDELRAIAEAEGEPTPVHRFFASLSPLLHERGLPQQLVVTADYDDALERSFSDAGEDVDVVSYLASGRNRGKFCHLSPDGSVHVITDPTEYAVELSLDRRPVILRVRGRAVQKSSREWESFVVTEDDHIDYLDRANVASGVPIALAATLRRSHFLFLGYSMSDWCLRLLLGRIWPEPPAYRSWAVGPKPGPVESELWRRFDVEFVEADERYVEALRAAIAVRPEVVR
jgi:DNA-binding SARP family transcriptional activator